MPKRVKKRNNSGGVTTNPMPPEGQYSGAGVGSFLSGVKGGLYHNQPYNKPKKSK